MVTDLISNSMLFTGGGSLLMGGMLGFAIKKTMKILAFVGGVGIACLAALESQKMINVDWNKVKDTTNSTAHYLYTQTDALVHHVAGQVDHTGMYVVGGGFVTGLLIGLKAG